MKKRMIFRYMAIETVRKMMMFKYMAIKTMRKMKIFKHMAIKTIRKMKIYNIDAAKGSELLREMRQSGLVIKPIFFVWTIFLKSSLLFFATVYARENNEESDVFQPAGH
jgi:hypothetical protein